MCAAVTCSGGPVQTSDDSSRPIGGREPLSANTALVSLGNVVSEQYHHALILLCFEFASYLFHVCEKRCCTDAFMCGPVWRVMTHGNL